MERLWVWIQAGAGEFFSRVNFVCWLLFGVCFTPMLLQWHIKDHDHSAKCAGGRLHLKPHTHTLNPLKLEWADYAAVQAECGNLSENKLKRNSSGNTQLQSSQLAESLWTDPGLKSGNSLCKLISTLKKREKKSAGGEWIVEHSPQILACEEKATTITTKPCFWSNDLLWLKLIENGSVSMYNPKYAFDLMTCHDLTHWEWSV